MPDQDFNLGSGFADAIGNFNDYQNGRIGRAAKEQSDAQNTSVVHNVTDGTVQVNMPADVFKEKAEAAAKYDQISAIYMRQVQELEAQRAQIKAHPFANTLAQIAGSMAANDTNPITRGLGQAALRLNPTDAELQAREQVPLRGALETAEAKTRSAETTVARLQAQERLNQQWETHVQNLDEKRQKDSQHALEWVEKHSFSKESVQQAAKLYGLDDKATSLLSAMVDDKRKEQERKTQEASAKMQFQRDTAMKVQAMRDVTARNALNVRQGDINERAAARREQTGYAKVEKDVNAALTSVAGVQHMRQVLNDPANTKYIGYIIGNYPTDLIPNADERKRVGEVKAEFFTLMNDVRNSFGAGARFWNPTEFSNLSPKLATATKTTATNLGILDAIEKDAIRVGKKMVQSSPDVDWETRGPMVFEDLWDQIKPKGQAGGLQGKAGGGKKEESKTLTYNPATGKVE